MLTLAPALMSLFVCLTSPRLAAVCRAVSPRSLRLLTFLSMGVRFDDDTGVVGDEGLGEDSEAKSMRQL